MAVLLPPECPICGAPAQWRCGLVFHRNYIHYKECARLVGDKQARTVATIVERTRRFEAHWSNPQPHNSGST